MDPSPAPIRPSVTSASRRPRWAPGRRTAGAAHFRRPAFSLAELMIAIVILGVGLLMVASMFPIAWTKARDLAEFTTTTACTDAAETTVRMLTRVSRVFPIDAPGSVPSFRGDDSGVYFAPGTLVSDALDPWVHALHVENYALNQAWPGTSPGDDPPLVGDFEPADGTVAPDPDLHPTPLPPVQIALHERVFPPLPSPLRLPNTPEAERHWKTLLDQRRYCWSVLHRLDYDPVVHLPAYLDPGDTSHGPSVDGPPPNRSTVRSVTMYIVTLRRGQATNRYARQNPAFVPAYTNPFTVGALPNSAVVVAPQALGLKEDVLFPSPWRVQIEIIDGTPADNGSIGLPGVPAEANANRGNGKPASGNGRLIAEMMPAGAQLIDERNGNIYVVARRDYALDQPNQALLTFTEEVPYESLDDNRDGTVDAAADADEFIRTVWVFPPAIEQTRASDGLPQFTGPQPVAGIEVRTIVFSP